MFFIVFNCTNFTHLFNFINLKILEFYDFIRLIVNINFYFFIIIVTFILVIITISKYLYFII